MINVGNSQSNVPKAWYMFWILKKYSEWLDRTYLFQNKDHDNEPSGFINNGQFAQISAFRESLCSMEVFPLKAYSDQENFYFSKNSRIRFINKRRFSFKSSEYFDIRPSLF
jgi:hypothetical protein